MNVAGGGLGPVVVSTPLTSAHPSGRDAGVPVIPVALTPARSAPASCAPLRLHLFRIAPDRFAPDRFTSARSQMLMFARDRSQPDRFAPGLISIVLQSRPARVLAATAPRPAETRVFDPALILVTVTYWRKYLLWWVPLRPYCWDTASTTSSEDRSFFAFFLLSLMLIF